MSRVTKPAEDVTHIPTANKQNKNTAPTGSVPDGNVSNRGGGEEEDKTLMLSREMALFINPKQADLTASLIIYGLYTWQVSKRNPFGYNPKINGKLACYRSLRELVEDYPWLRHNSILKAVNRAAAKLKDDFIMRVVKRNGQAQLHFLLSDNLIKKYKFDCSELHTKGDRDGNIIAKYWKRRKSGLIGFQKSDAIKYGMMGAILISNLKYVVDPDNNVEPLKDDAGNIYRELSPTALTKPMEDKNGEMKPPLPVSSDTITRELKYLKDAGMFCEHAVQNNFYMLVSTMKLVKGDAAEVTTTAAEVTTHAAEVNSKSEVPDCKPCETNDLQSKIETPDSNRDDNEDRKCVIQETSPLRCDVSWQDAEMSDGAKKLMALVNEGLSAFRQKDKTGVPKFNIHDHAVYRVDDYDRVSIIGYEFEHEFIKADWHTGKPYTRKLEVDNYMKECEVLFGIKGLPYTNTDKAKLRTLFMDHPKFTPDIINDLISHDYFGDFPVEPKKGHDFDFFARKLTSVQYFLRYLPQLIREKHLNTVNVEADHHPLTKKPMFDYSEMEPWLMKIAFDGSKTPVGWYYVPLEEARPEVGCYLENGERRNFLTGETRLVETTRVKAVSYEEFTNPEIEWIAYEVTHSPNDRLHAEMLALPLLWEEQPEPKDFSSVAIRDWKRRNGNPVDL